MQVQHVMYKELDGSKTLTLIMEGGALQARIRDYGTSHFEVECRDLEDRMPQMLPGIDFWGSAMVWAEPVTAGHLIWDVYRNAA